MEVVPFDQGLREAWNAFNRRARNGHFMFDRNFMEYHADRFEDASLVALEDGRVRGLVPANRRGDVVHSHQGLTFGGLVVADARSEAVLAMLDAAAEAWRAQGAARLVYKPLPWIYQRRPAQEDLYWLFRRDARLVRRDLTTTIRMSERGEASQRRVRGAKKAAKAGVSVARSQRYAEFWAVLTERLQERHGVAPVHTLDEIRLLAERFPDELVLLTAELDGVVAAGSLIFVAGPTAHAQYIAASDLGREVGALDSLFLAAIEMFTGACAYFDFGISNEDGGRVLNAGLARQKEEFGGSGVVHDVYEVELV